MASEEGLRTLFVTRCFPPATGGMERFAKDLSSAVSEKSDVTILSWGGSKAALLVVLPYFFIRSLWSLIKQQVDVLHAQDGVVSIVLAPLARIFNKPMVVVIHGLDVTYQNTLYQSLIRRSLHHAKTVICISNAAKEAVLKRGVNARKVQVIPLGITDDLFMNDKTRARAEVEKFARVSKDAKLLLASGRLVERKGVDWFIAEVLPLIIKKQPETVLLVSGEGPWRTKIETVVEEQGLANSVRLLGRTTDEQLKYLYNACDCFVMPNVIIAGDMEGFGRVLLEAALCAVPVVASGIEGIVDAIRDGKNGQLVGPRQAKEHTKAILEIIGNPTRARKIGAQARSYTLRHYSWPVIAESYVDVYRNVAKGGSAQ